MKYAVIMAGGTGKRLWPLSRQKRPKQVLKLLDGQTLLTRCFDRLRPVFDVRNILVLTNAEYADLVREDLHDLPMHNVIAEPAVRDTAGAIGLAAAVLAKHDPAAVMSILTADQLIEPPEVLQQALKDAFEFIAGNPDALITFGIKPTFPSTQLGYIKCVNPREWPRCRNAVYSVESFREKPDRPTAERYVGSGQYFWNSGMFVWRAQTILANLHRFLPDSVEPLRRIAAAWDTPRRGAVVDKVWPALPKIAIDYTVAEPAAASGKLVVIPGDFDWDDVGDFASIAKLHAGGRKSDLAILGENARVLADSSTGVVISQSGRLISLIGVTDIVVVDTPDALLVTTTANAQRVKSVVDALKVSGRDDVL